MLNKATRFFAVCLLLAQSTTAGAALPFASGEIPNRNDIPDAFKWKLEDIYTNDAEWEKEYAQLKAKIPTTMRNSRGRDVDAACGQLRLRRLTAAEPPPPRPAGGTG